jgi:hypothetical protein
MSPRKRTGEEDACLRDPETHGAAIGAAVDLFSDKVWVALQSARLNTSTGYRTSRDRLRWLPVSQPEPVAEIRPCGGTETLARVEDTTRNLPPLQSGDPAT